LENLRMNLPARPFSIRPAWALLTLALSPVTLARAEEPPNPAKVPAAASTAKKAKKLPKIFDPDIVGTKAIQAGVAVCTETNRRPFVVFGTNDCDPCRVFNDALHEPLFFSALAKQFVPILIDVTPGSPNAELLKNYGIDPSKGLPAVGIFEVDQTPPQVTRNGELVAVTKKGIQATQEWILAHFHKEMPDLKK
jgi:hypothetical protein